MIALIIISVIFLFVLYALMASAQWEDDKNERISNKMNNEIKHLDNGDFEVMCECGKPIHRYDAKGKFKYTCPCGHITEGRYEDECKIIDEIICQTSANALT